MILSRWLSGAYIYISGFRSAERQVYPETTFAKNAAAADKSVTSSSSFGADNILPAEAFAQMRQIQGAASRRGVSISVHLWQRSFERISPALMPEGFSVSQKLKGRTGGGDASILPLKHLAASSATHVFSLVESPNLVLVYRQFCVEGELVDTAVRDFWFLRYIEPLQIAPKVHLVSEALDGELLVDNWGIPAAELIGKLKLNSCGLSLSSVRYILMDRVLGSSVNELLLIDLNFKLPLAIAAQWGVLLVSALQKLHERNVIHGDIHWGNVVVSEDKSSIKLIDFEHAKLYDKVSIDADSKPSCGMLPVQISPLFTLWESQLCSYSFRDDIFRVLLVVAVSMHGARFAIYFRDLCKNGDRDTWIQHRKNGDVFRVPGTDWMVEYLQQDDFSEHIYQKLNRITTLVNALGLHERPNYAQLINLFQDVAQLSEHNH